VEEGNVSHRASLKIVTTKKRQEKLRNNAEEKNIRSLETRKGGVRWGKGKRVGKERDNMESKLDQKDRAAASMGSKERAELEEGIRS